jgi:TonB family protein
VWSRVEHGSGSPRLDGSALDPVLRAAPYPPPPRGMTASNLTFRVPIVFAHR